MNMVIVESLCLSIVALSLLLRIYFKGAWQSQVLQYVLIASVAWLTENTCIHFYGFYSYSPTWHVFIDQVPIMIPLIWPIVLLSARDLVVPVRKGPWGTGLFVGLLVFTDAAFIEPISVHLGFWQWYEPGFFEVPVIGVLGWGLFAMFGLFALGPELSPSPRRLGLFIILPPLFTHLALLASWWSCFRWITAEILDQWTVTVSLSVLSLFALGLWRVKAVRGIASRDIWLRFPAALFFFGLLSWDFPRVKGALLLFALAFSLPYLSLCALVFFRGKEDASNEKRQGNESESLMPVQAKG